MAEPESSPEPDASGSASSSEPSSSPSSEPEPSPSSSAPSSEVLPTLSTADCDSLASGSSVLSLPAWDSSPLAPSACSLALGSYSPEVQQELAAIRVSVSYGLALVALPLWGLLILKWRR